MREIGFSSKLHGDLLGSFGALIGCRSMDKFRQTWARVGAGLTAMAALCWVLWPSKLSDVSSNPEPIFVFLVALLTWTFTEFKFSEEVQFRESSPNDIRVARELVELHAGQFRYLLKDADLFQFVESDCYSQVNNLCNRHETGKLEFQNKGLNKKLENLIGDLEKLGLFVAQHTVPEMIGGVWRTGFKPFDNVTQERYDELLVLSGEANELASNAWEKLDSLVSIIKIRVPEALDEKI